MKLDYPVKHSDVLEVLILPSVAQAMMLENSFYGTLKPYQEGWYMPGEISPILVPNHQYFIIEGAGRNQRFVPISDLNGVERDVYNSNGQLAVTSYVVKNRDKILSSTPTVPVRGIRLLKAVVDYHIAEVSAWMRTDAYERALRSCFHEELYDQLDIDSIVYVVNNTITQVNQFMNHHDWNHYYTKLIGYDLIIEKGADYRVCEWYEKKTSGEW